MMTMNSNRDQIILELRKRLAEARTVLQAIPEFQSEGASEERLEILIKREKPQFYVVSEGERRYLRKCESEHAKRLALKEYYQKLKAAAKAEEKAIISFLRSYRPGAKLEVYEKLSAARKNLIQPILLPDDRFIAEWQSKCSKLAAESPNSLAKPDGFRTNNGEYVRSKSEKILADQFAFYKIPYVYECPLRLPAGIVFPDFTLLDMNTRKTVYWEHFGRMSDPEYAEKAQKKLHLYLQAGFLPGRDLIISSETLGTPLNMADIDTLLAHLRTG